MRLGDQIVSDTLRPPNLSDAVNRCPPAPWDLPVGLDLVFMSNAPEECRRGAEPALSTPQRNQTHDEALFCPQVDAGPGSLSTMSAREKGM